MQVYTEYDPADPPPHPGPAWTRFVCISDTHSRSLDIPPGDALLHAGDLSSWGYVPQLETTVEWLTGLPHPIKIMIAGNHDLCLDPRWVEGGDWYKQTGGDLTAEDLASARALVRSPDALAARVHYLEYQSIKFTTTSGRTWEVYGSPAVPRYAAGAFQYEEDTEEGEDIYAQIPPTTDILLTHGPPYRICDKTKRHKHAGCRLLAARMADPAMERCRLHVFGHIHEAHGAHVDQKRNRVSVNAAVYHRGQPIIVDLRN